MTDTPTEAKTTRGRPKKYETKQQKLTLYLSPEMFKIIKTISSAKNISMTDYAVNILEQDLAKKKSVVEQILTLQESL